MIEISIVSRGGQGGKKLSKLIAQAAFLSGKQVQSFALYGAERRGAKVLSFCRIDDHKIELRGYIENPDYIIILDDSLEDEATKDIDWGSTTILINTSDFENLNFSWHGYYGIDANKISTEIIGRPITNTTMLGFFARCTGVISIQAAVEAIRMTLDGLPDKALNANVKACMAAYGDE